MNLREKEDELFARWRPTVDGFVSDGAVSPEAYSSSSPKILLLMKEVNDLDGGGWCLREFLQEGGRKQTWDNVTRWVRGIRRLPAEISWEDLESVTEEQRCEALRTVAAFNLKKSPGGHTTDVSAFEKVVERDAEFLRQQFAIYSADLVICCGSIVAEAFHSFMKPSNSGQWCFTSRGVEYLKYEPGKYVINYAHPKARVASNLLHYGLMDTVRELRLSPTLSL